MPAVSTSKYGRGARDWLRNSFDESIFIFVVSYAEETRLTTPIHRGSRGVESNKPERILSVKRYLEPSDSRRLIVFHLEFFLFSFSFFLLLFSSSHRIGAVDKKYEEIEVVAVFYYACTSDFFRQLGCLPNVEKLKRPRASKQDRNRVEYLGRIDNSTASKTGFIAFSTAKLCFVSFPVFLKIID